MSCHYHYLPLHPFQMNDMVLSSTLEHPLLRNGCFIVDGEVMVKCMAECIGKCNGQVMEKLLDKWWMNSIWEEHLKNGMTSG
jgi:hypothetical protein